MSAEVIIYNNGQHRYLFTEGTGPAAKKTVVGPGFRGAIPAEIWEHWKKVLTKDQLSFLIEGGAIPASHVEKVTALEAAVSDRDARLAKLEQQIAAQSALLLTLQQQKGSAPR